MPYGILVMHFHKPGLLLSVCVTKYAAASGQFLNLSQLRFLIYHLSAGIPTHKGGCEA